MKTITKIGLIGLAGLALSCLGIRECIREYNKGSYQRGYAQALDDTKIRFVELRDFNKDGTNEIRCEL